MAAPSYLRRRRRESRARRWGISQRRYRELLAREIRAARTAARHQPVGLAAWGECPECGCIGAPGHRCDGGLA